MREGRGVGSNWQFGSDWGQGTTPDRVVGWQQMVRDVPGVGCWIVEGRGFGKIQEQAVGLERVKD